MNSIFDLRQNRKVYWEDNFVKRVNDSFDNNNNCGNGFTYFWRNTFSWIICRTDPKETWIIPDPSKFWNNDDQSLIFWSNARRTGEVRFWTILSRSQFNKASKCSKEMNAMISDMYAIDLDLFVIKIMITFRRAASLFLRTNTRTVTFNFSGDKWKERD